MIFSRYDVLVFLHMPIDRYRAVEQAVHVLADVAQFLLNLAPVGSHASQQRVTFAALLAIQHDRLLVRFHERLVYIG